MLNSLPAFYTIYRKLLENTLIKFFPSGILLLPIILNSSYPDLGPKSLDVQGIAVYGFGNWDGVAEHVGTKSKLQCLNHYNAIYMNSPCFPLPVRLSD